MIAAAGAGLKGVNFPAMRHGVYLEYNDRAWEPFHSPKNLAMGLACEAAEVMEHFLWLECEASRQWVRDPANLAQEFPQ